HYSSLYFASFVYATAPSLLFTLSLHNALPILIVSLPLNNNGKLDRKAIPKPVRRRPHADFFKPAKSPSEKILVKLWAELLGVERDRKSTRLNSSHVKISYAVFCL